MVRRLLAHSAAGLLLTPLLAAASRGATPAFDEVIAKVAPGLSKWAVACLVTEKDGALAFAWHEYQDTADRTDFWPASCVKLYVAVAALELLNELGAPLDCVVSFEHQANDGRWVLDSARCVREMLSEVFRRSSNEDYTLLLRLVGIDRLNTQFLVPARGFPHSALMRGYVAERPWLYVLEEPQRLRLQWAGEAGRVLEHTWSGRFYAAERGCTVIDANTGNVTSPRELAECLRRILFHERLPEAERYHLSAEQLQALRLGGAGYRGLENKDAESDPSAWTNGIETVFPQARYFHKSGLISNYALEVAYVDDAAASGKRFILVPVVNAGYASTPGGETRIGELARAAATWVQAQP